MGMYILYFQTWKRDSQQQHGAVIADTQYLDFLHLPSEFNSCEKMKLAFIRGDFQGLDQTIQHIRSNRKEQKQILCRLLPFALVKADDISSGHMHN